MVFLVLLLANPIFQTGAGLFAGGGPVSLVVLLDNSLSMTWSGDGNGFKQAKEAAKLLISALNDGDRAALLPTSITGKETIRLKTQKDVLAKRARCRRDRRWHGQSDRGARKSLRAFERARRSKGNPLDHGYGAYRLGPIFPRGAEARRSVDSSQIDSRRQKRTAAEREHQGNPPRQSGCRREYPAANRSDVGQLLGPQEIKDMLVQLSIDGQNKEQKLATLSPKGEATVNFQTRVNQAGAHTGQVSLKKDGLAGNAVANFTLDAQDKLRVLVVDGDPQTSLVQSESFFLSRALNPAGERDSSLFLPSVIVPDALNTATLDSYQVVVLCNVAALPGIVLSPICKTSCAKAAVC